MTGSDFLRVPISEITRPKDGRQTLMNRYWIVTENNEVLFYKKTFPQCNSREDITNSLLTRFKIHSDPIFTNAKVKFIKLAFIPDR